MSENANIPINNENKKPKRKYTRKIKEKKEETNEKKQTKRKYNKKIKENITDMVDTPEKPEKPEKPENKMEPQEKGIIQDFKENGISVLEPLPENVLNNIIELTNKEYYNNHPLLTDNEYDIIKEYIANKYPKNTTIQKIGAPIQGKNKVKLPYNMPSMDKIKPDSGALTNWTAKYSGPYVLSCKLDGVSGLYVSSHKGEYKLYTRGDGHIGQDISQLISTLRLPQIPQGMAVRGEFILPKKIFAEKYAAEFANARNLVSGIINRKTPDEKAADLHFVAYEIIEPSVKPSIQMTTLEREGFRVVQHRLAETISNTSLSDLLVEWRKTYDYEIDGIIVTNDAIHERTIGNPDHAFAFKMVLSDQLAEAKVVDVIWEASKAGYLKPRVRIEPIQLGGVKIEYATGFNGKFIEDNRIGIGAVIMMVRSGDVIPYIKSVTTPAEKSKMPSVPYIWNKTHVDILLENPHEDTGVQEKNITLFFTTLEVDGLAKGNVHKIYESGRKTVADILKMTAADFENIDGFKEKTAKKLFQGIQEKVAAASLLDIMVASGKMGRGLGERKIRPILSAYPDILTSVEDPQEKEARLHGIAGIGPENSREFVKNIPSFLDFLRTCGLEGKLQGGPPVTESVPVTKGNIDSPLSGKKIVMTKVRDKDIISFMTKVGATLEDTMKKDTFVLIVKAKEDTSNKTEYAVKNGIPIMTVEEFKASYM